MNPYFFCFYCEREFLVKLPAGEVSGNPIPDQSLQNCYRTKDHIIPESKGGIKGEPNIVWACRTCNHLKGHKLPEEFLEFLKDCVIKNMFYSLRKGEFLKVIANTKKLIEKVNKDRAQYVWAVNRDNSPGLFTSNNIVNLLSPASSAKQARSKAELLARFRAKYPYAYKLIEEANPDLPRWIIDNLTHL